MMTKRWKYQESENRAVHTALTALRKEVQALHARVDELEDVLSALGDAADPEIAKEEQEKEKQFWEGVNAILSFGVKKNEP